MYLLTVLAFLVFIFSLSKLKKQHAALAHRVQQLEAALTQKAPISIDPGRIQNMAGPAGGEVVQATPAEAILPDRLGEGSASRDCPAPATDVPNIAESPEALAKGLEAPVVRDKVKDVCLVAQHAPATTGGWQHSFWSLMKQNLFATAGIVLLLLGFAVLFKSIEWGELLSPVAKAGLAGLASLGMGALGVRLSARKPLWGQLVQGGAGAVAY